MIPAYGGSINKQFSCCVQSQEIVININQQTIRLSFAILRNHFSLLSTTSRGRSPIRYQGCSLFILSVPLIGTKDVRFSWCRDFSYFLSFLQHFYAHFKHHVKVCLASLHRAKVTNLRLGCTARFRNSIQNCHPAEFLILCSDNPLIIMPCEKIVTQLLIIGFLLCSVRNLLKIPLSVSIFVLLSSKQNAQSHSLAAGHDFMIPTLLYRLHPNSHFMAARLRSFHSNFWGCTIEVLKISRCRILVCPIPNFLASSQLQKDFNWYQIRLESARPFHSASLPQHVDLSLY